MKFNRKSLSIQEIDYAVKLAQFEDLFDDEAKRLYKSEQTQNDSEQYNATYEKQLNVKVTKFNENTNPSNFYYNFIFHDSFIYKQRNVNKRYYPMLKRYQRKMFSINQDECGLNDNDIKRIIFQHKKKYKLHKMFRKTYKQLKQRLGD